MTNQELIEQYQSLTAKAQSLATELTSKKATFNTLKSQYDTKLKALLTQYKCSTLDELKAYLSTESQSLEKSVQQASSLLSVFNPTSSLEI